MKSWFVLAALLLLLVPATLKADPGNFGLQVKVGPAFELVDLETQFKGGVEFDYELEYGFTINLASFIAFGADIFVFQMIPMLKYNVLYIYPAVIYLGYGLGFSTLDSQTGLAMRFTTGINLPLNSHLDAVTDLSLITIPGGTPGTPTSLDWLIGLRFKFN